MEAEVALLMFHVNTEACPALMVIGFAVKLFIIGLPSTPTVTVTVLVTEPVLLVAVSVYVVVVAGYISTPKGGAVPTP